VAGGALGGILGRIDPQAVQKTQEKFTEL